MLMERERETYASGLASTGPLGLPHLVPPPGGMSVQDLARANRAALRAQIADRIVRDIALLDALDGDPDLEPEPVEADADAEGTAAEWAGSGAQRFNIRAAA